MSDSISRRIFIGGAVAAASVPAAQKLPTRTLGRTGATPSIMALGCGSRLTGYGTQEKGVETINMALERGVTYLDTAQSYGGGKSETWVGEVMKTRRKEVFLATKTQKRDPDELMRAFEESLKRLNTDQTDLLHLHSLQGPDDLAEIERVKLMETMYKIREQGMTRFIGITSHTNPHVLATALERYDVDCTQMALNAAKQGMQSGKGGMALNPAMPTSFEDTALKVARLKNLGVIAMKVFGQGRLMSTETEFDAAARMMRYSLSLEGVSVAVCGCPKHEYLDRNVETARAFAPMKSSEMRRYSDEMSDKHKQALDRVFESHVDA